jgi:hypothetical protein
MCRTLMQRSDIVSRDNDMPGERQQVNLPNQPIQAYKV